MTHRNRNASANCRQDVFDLLFDRRQQALFALWKDTADVRDAERMREFGCRQGEVSGLIQAIHGARS